MDCIIIDDLPPEVVAMLQALYSRSPRSVREHLEQVLEKGPEKFMSTYYVEYDHKSIGDCGTTSVFVENISMLAAKAIQDNPLYSGQEASTRYLDMAKQSIVNPLGTTQGEMIQQTWVSLYKDILATLIPHFEERFPRHDWERKSHWKKAIKARAFDVARGFLPAGCQTYVAWHTNLRQASDHLKLLRYHPCAEIRDMESRIRSELLSRYPSSFNHKRYNLQEDYLKRSAAYLAYSDNDLTEFSFTSSLDLEALAKHFFLLESRPQKTELHQRFRQYGSIQFQFPLDFGSYRDLQRHRSCVQEMPLLTTKHGIMPWYIEQLPEKWQEIATKVMHAQETIINKLDISPEEKQYYVAMGYTCPIKITCSLPSAVYIAELRSGTTTHPTLRKIAQQMGSVVKELIPGIAMHCDPSEGVWNIKRGTQDIIKVEKVT